MQSPPAPDLPLEWVEQSGHWQVRPQVQPDPASVVNVLKGGTTVVGREISGKSKGGRSSTGVGVGAGGGERGFLEGERTGVGEVCSLELENESSTCCE